MISTDAIDPAWQAEWAASYAMPRAVRESRANSSLLEFMLGQQSYALPVFDVWAAAEPSAIVALPGRRDRIVHGLFQLDGQLLLAADLRRLLNPGRAAAPPAAGDVRFPRVLVLGSGIQTFAVHVDDVPGTFRPSAEAESALPVTMPAGTASLASGVRRRQGRSLTILDGSRLLDALTRDLQ